MYLVKNFILLLLKVGVALLFLGGVLWAISQFISIDEHRKSVLQRINSHAPFELRLGETKLVLVPYPGVAASTVELASKDGREVAKGNSGKFLLVLNTLFSSERGIRLSIPRAEVLFDPNDSEMWNSFWPRGRKIPPKVPKSTSTPNAITQKIEARSRELAGIPTPRPTPDLPAYLRPPPTPTPEPPSLLENIDFRGMDISELSISGIHDGSFQSWVQASQVTICISNREWKVRGFIQKGTIAPITQFLPMCEGEEKKRGNGKLEFSLTCGRR